MLAMKGRSFLTTEQDWLAKDTHVDNLTTFSLPYPTPSPYAIQTRLTFSRHLIFKKQFYW